MKITTKEIIVPKPPRIHTLELTDNELGILRYITNWYAATIGERALAERFLEQTKTDVKPEITAWTEAFSATSTPSK